MSNLEVIVIGAGLGGLGAAIALRLAGHEVDVLESASEIREVGAGIQVLPNSTRVLDSWGVIDRINKLRLYSTDTCRILGWKGNQISSMDFASASNRYGSLYYDLYRADLHNALLERAIELGVKLHINSEVTHISFISEKSRARIFVRGGNSLEADLAVAADGLHSKCREILLGRPDPPRRTGDMAYRLLLDGDDIAKDPELRPILQEKAVTYWYGPGSHIVTYALRGGKLLNMVLCVPDDLPEDGPSTVQGQVDEMQKLFRDWDPRIGKLIKRCTSVLRWRLSIRDPIPSWIHPSNSMVMLGDSVHATLPYLASGAGMCFEDGAVLGYCLADVSSSDGKAKALKVYEQCRIDRTRRIVERGSLQMYLNHLEDGMEQEERDRKMRDFEHLEDDLKVNKEVELPSGLKPGDDPLVWRRFGAGDWLMSYDCKRDVESRWDTVTDGEI